MNEIAVKRFLVTGERRKKGLKVKKENIGKDSWTKLLVNQVSLNVWTNCMHDEKRGVFVKRMDKLHAWRKKRVVEMLSKKALRPKWCIKRQSNPRKQEAKFHEKTTPEDKSTKFNGLCRFSTVTSGSKSREHALTEKITASKQSTIFLVF